VVDTIEVVFIISSTKALVGVGRPGVIVAMVAKYLLNRARYSKVSFIRYSLVRNVRLYVFFFSYSPAETPYNQ